MEKKTDLRVSSHQRKLGAIVIWIIFLASIRLATMAYWKAEIIYQGLQDAEVYRKFYLLAILGLMFVLV